MKVLVDCAPLSMGGAVQVAIALMLNLRDCPDISWRAVLSEQMRAAVGPDLAADPRVSFVWKRSWKDFLLLYGKLRAIERAFEPDVVFTVFGPTYFVSRAPHLMGFALPNLIYDADCPATARTVSDKVADRIRAFLLRRANHLVVETETVRKRLADRIGIEAGKISVIGNCVNPVLLAVEATPAPKDGPFVILIPSAFYRHKNLQIVPRVAAELKRINPELDFVFRLTLSPQKDVWRGIAGEAEELGVGRQVTTLGPLPLAELAVAYRHASAVMLPTLREASTAVYPEAFYMQRPLVTSDLDFARELCGEAALFATPHDPAAFARALDRLARDRAMREQLVALGKQQLEIGYPSTSDKFNMQIDLLRHVAGSRSVGPK
ncbi:MAG: glycosyltransferase family 4 protein [Hyphomicrobiaceae bacterium]